MQKGIKIRLYPNKEQINKMNSFLMIKLRGNINTS